MEMRLEIAEVAWGFRAAPWLAEQPMIGAAQHASAPSTKNIEKRQIRLALRQLDRVREQAIQDAKRADPHVWQVAYALRQLKA